jgi:D-alanyl-lipoteichoic acid acyltransferase DltB (MBOAT superfamily)
MFFNSLSYVVFLFVVVVAYWLLPRRWQFYLLLLASVLFYGFWKIEFLVLIVFSAFVDYFVSLRINDASTQKTRRAWLFTSLVINLGLLIYFKYTYFIFDNLIALGNLFGANWQATLWKIILPLGISFYTFVSLSYTIDVYRKKLIPVRSFALYLTYVMFWPHMIAGPILRGHELINQLRNSHPFRAENVFFGIKQIITGLFLKVALADQIAPLVDSAFSSKTALLGGIDVWAMAFGFGLQIYFDFAGYSLVAIGSARLLGIHFPQNFNWPYLAVSPRDFWKRWHITLSTWIRDYLYLPLGGIQYVDPAEGEINVKLEGARASKQMLTVALFVSWFVMGLWHGANWKFAIWGLWHAAIIYIYRQVKARFGPTNKYLENVLGWSLTLPAVMLAWIFFRAATLQQSVELLIKIVNFRSYSHLSFRENFYLLIFILMAGMMIGAFWRRPSNSFLNHPVIKGVTETILLAVMLFAVFVFLKPVSQFIYFQF